MTFWNDPVNFLAQWFTALLTGWGLAPALIEFLRTFVGAAILALGGILWVIFLIWYERKIFGRIQDRLGPNRVGPWGVFQPFADMLKIFTKEFITPQGADKVPYNLAPVMAVAGTLMVWAVIPFAVNIFGVDLDVAVLYVIASTGIAELGIIFAGWGSNNKYALLGAFRSIALLISYEVPMIITLLIPVMLSSSMKLNVIVQEQSIWYILMAPLAAIIFFISQMAETGRAPFDLAEADSEIVAGYNIEYSGLKFGFFYVAEFLHAFTISLIFATLFLGGWRGPWAGQVPFLGVLYFGFKTMLVYFVVILLKGSLPRFRIDQMMDLNWKILTPVALVLVMATALVAKLIPAGMNGVLFIALFVANVVILLVTSQFLRAAARNRRPLNVVPKAYLSPRPDGPSSQPSVE